MKFLNYSFALLFLLFVNSAFSQTLQKATGGDGLYKESIWWLDFTGVEIEAGETVIQTYDINGLITLVIEIEDISFGGNLLGSRPLSSQRLIGYKSGHYFGDGLVKLYNIGVPNDGVTSADRKLNTLYNALSFKYSGNQQGNGHEAVANLTVKAHAYLTASGDPVDVGLIFADAETDENVTSSALTIREYSQGTTNGLPWRVLETAKQDNNGEQKLVISDNGHTARTICGFNGTTVSTGNVIIMYTLKYTTTSTDPLVVDMKFQGGGRTATAIGFLLNSSDKGDAPASYGMPENIFFTQVLDGLPPSDGNYYISSTGSKGGTPVLTQGHLGYAQTPRLGSLAGDPDDYNSIEGLFANYDNILGINDEDALGSIPALNTRMTSYSLTFDATPTPGQNAYINAWVDFNLNGTFDANEFQAVTISNAGAVTLTWNDIEVAAGLSYLRIRIQSNVPGISTGAYDIKMGGETEDYSVNVTTFISGNVFHDINGLQGTPANTVDGAGINTIEGSTLYVTLLDNTGSYLDQVMVNADGSYEFSNIQSGTYSLILTTVASGTTPSLPTNWVNTGEHIGLTAGADADANGRISVSIPNGGAEVSQVNFGVQALPDSDNKTTTLSNQPYSNAIILLDGIDANPPFMSGEDLEDGLYDGHIGELQTPMGVIITSLPTDGELYYNDVLVTVADILDKTIFENPELFSLKLTGTGYTFITFDYAYVDHAGYEDPTPASYTIDWSTPLPVTYIYFNAEAAGHSVELTWKTQLERNNSRFEVQRSADGSQWETVGVVSSVDTRDYQYSFVDQQPFKGTSLYRLNQIDINNDHSYSEIRKVYFNMPNAISVYPNPSSDIIYIDGLKEGMNEIKIFNAIGQVVYQYDLIGDTQHQVDMRQLSNGNYYITIHNRVSNSSALIQIIKN